MKHRSAIWELNFAHQHSYRLGGHCPAAQSSPAGLIEYYDAMPHRRSTLCCGMLTNVVAWVMRKVQRFTDDKIQASQFCNGCRGATGSLRTLAPWYDRPRLLDGAESREVPSVLRSLGCDSPGYSTHICAKTENARFSVDRKTIVSDSPQNSKQSEELRRRWHEPVAEVGKWLRSCVYKLLQYHACPATSIVCKLSGQVVCTGPARCNGEPEDRMPGRFVAVARGPECCDPAPRPAMRFNARYLGKSRMQQSARTDLCGARVNSVPTATVAGRKATFPYAD